MSLAQGEKKSAIPSPTMSLRAPAAPNPELKPVRRALAEATKTPTNDVLLGPYFAARSPPGIWKSTSTKKKLEARMPSPDTPVFSSMAMGAKMDAMLYQLTAYTTLATISDQNAPRWATFRSKCCGKSLLAFLIVVPITLRSMRSVDSQCAVAAHFEHEEIGLASTLALLATLCTRFLRGPRNS